MHPSSPVLLVPSSSVDVESVSVDVSVSVEVSVVDVISVESVVESKSVGVPVVPSERDDEMEERLRLSKEENSGASGREIEGPGN